MRYVKDLTTIETDVLVCGGGCAGVGAALSAARAGAKTMLLEKNGYTGGIVTAVHNPFFDGLTDLNTGEIVVRGIAFELYTSMGYANPNDTHLNIGHQTIDPEKFKLIVDRCLRQAKARTWYHTPVVDVIARHNRIEAVITANKGGVCAVVPKVVIDATGDADVAAWAGAPFEISQITQPMTLHYRIGNVAVHDGLPDRCGEVLRRSFEAGELGTYGGPWMFSIAHDEVAINATRLFGDALSPDEKTAAEARGREDAWMMFEIWRRELPEFKNAYMIITGPEIGVRETRRIVGEYTLTIDDIYQTRPFDDAIVKGAWYLDLHPSDGSIGIHPHRQFVPKPYDIPYRTLLPQQVENLLVAGRCHSATREALSSSRVTITAMGMGEAAGYAAALACKRNCGVRDIKGNEIRESLIQSHQINVPYGRSAR